MFATRSNGTSLFLLAAAFLAGAASAQTQTGASQCVNTCINQIVSNQDSGCGADDSKCVCSNTGFQPCLTQQCQGQDNPASAYCNGGSANDGSDGGSALIQPDGETTTTTATETQRSTSTTPTTTFTGTGITASSYYSVSSQSAMSTASAVSVSRSSTSASASASNKNDATAAVRLGGEYAGAATLAVGALGVIVDIVA